VTCNAFTQIPPHVGCDPPQDWIALPPTLREMQDWMQNYDNLLIAAPTTTSRQSNSPPFASGSNRYESAA
jgi:hypothetical protein